MTMRRNRHARIARTLGLAVALGMGALAAGFSTAGDANAAENARELMNKVSTTRKLAGSEAVVKMSIINAAGQKRERELSMATKLYDNGNTEKRIYRFLAPADVKGTGVLVFDHQTEGDDVWIFLPALRKTRRIVSSERSKSFMGSEFSYGDLNIPALDDYTYEILKEESAGGENCWVIEVKPKTPAIASSEGYSKKSYWVSKANYTVRKGLYYDLDGKKLKELKTSDVKLLDAKNKRYRAMHMEMVNLQNNRRSVFDSTKVAFVPDTKDEYFTTRYLERP